MTNMQRKVMFSSKSDLWETPQDFFDNLDKEFHFTLDACALPENAKCQKYYTPEDDGLLQPWSGVVWCNPPYSECAEWAKKCYEESRGGGTRWCFWFRPELIRSGFINMFTRMLKFDS